MVSDPRTERFLSLEGTANDLVDELNQLREQISKYKEASDSLSAGSEALETLAKELATLVESVGETIRAEIDLGNAPSAVITRFVSRRPEDAQ